MVRHAEFGANTFMGTPAEAEAHVSSPTAQGYFAIFAWFDYEEGGGAVFELRLHMQAGIQDVLRRGPSLTALAHEGPGLLQERLRHAEREKRNAMQELENMRSRLRECARAARLERA